MVVFRVGAVLLGASIWVAGGCNSLGAYSCESDDHCISGSIAGRCELATNACSFPDLSCSSGHRYAELSGDGLGGACVDETSENDGSDGAEAFDDTTVGGTTTGTTGNITTDDGDGTTSVSIEDDGHADDDGLSTTTSGYTDDTTGSTTGYSSTGDGGSVSGSSDDSAGDDSAGDSGGEPPPDPVTREFGECSGCDVVDVTEDTFLKPNSSHNLGAHPDLHVGDGHTALLRFDLSSIAGATVQEDARLDLEVNLLDASSISFSFYRVLESWSEGSEAPDYNDGGDPGIANWYQRHSGVSWSNDGAGSPGSRESSSFATRNVSSSGHVSITIPASVVQSWIDDPSSNHGMAFRGSVSGWGYVLVESAESSSASSRPALTITYIP